MKQNNDFSRMKYLMGYNSKHFINELNVDQALLPKRVDTFKIGDVVKVIGDTIPAAEYNPRINKVISLTNFDADYNSVTLELIKKIGPYWVMRTDEGRYYRIANQELTKFGNFQSLSETSESISEEDDILDEGIRELFDNLEMNLTKGMITAATLIAMMTANVRGQENPSDGYEKNGEIVQSVKSLGDKKLINDLKVLTGIDWGDEQMEVMNITRSIKLNQKDNKWDEKKMGKRNPIPKLDLGAYYKINAAKVTKSNHAMNFNEYVYYVEIPDNRYVESGKIFDEIRKYNSELTGVTINFTHKGDKIIGKSIKL